MKYDSQKPEDVKKSDKFYENLKRLGKQFELKECKITRSSLLNSALHLYFTLICYQLNELGLEFNYTGIKGLEMSTRYTPHIVKELIWKPIQMALFDIESTTKVNSKEINEVIDVLSKFFGDRGVEIEFPCIESLMNKKQ
jgi:hypothetical protein